MKKKSQFLLRPLLLVLLILAAGTPSVSVALGAVYAAGLSGDQEQAAPVADPSGDPEQAAPVADPSDDPEQETPSAAGSSNDNSVGIYGSYDKDHSGSILTFILLILFGGVSLLTTGGGILAFKKKNEADPSMYANRSVFDDEENDNDQ